MRVKAGGTRVCRARVAGGEFLSADELTSLATALDAEAGDLLLLVAYVCPRVRHVLGLMAPRSSAARR
jgi:hypothetical protein